MARRFTPTTLPNGNRSQYTYTSRGWIDTLNQWTMVKGLLLASYDYGYDAAGNRTSVTETVNGQTVNIAWGHDDANRLITETRANSSNQVFRTTGYTYDDAGNRTSATVDGETTSYIYNNLDQFTQVTKPNGQVHTYTYDGRGNLKQISKPGGNNENYEYDARNRLIEATIGSTTTISYAYDTDGQRISENANGVVTKFVWDPFSAYGDVVAETNASNVVTASYVLGNGSLIAQTKNGTTSFFLPDAQGSTRTLTNTAGTAAATYTYSAFGETLTHTGTAESRYLYTGQQFDTLTELYSLRARYYDLNVGRFLSRDTWAYDYQNPVEFNRYGYAANNPVTLADPSGLTSSGYAASSTVGISAIGQLNLTGFAVRAVVVGTALYIWATILVTVVLPNVDNIGEAVEVYPPPEVIPAEEAWEILNDVLAKLSKRPSLPPDFSPDPKPKPNPLPLPIDPPVTDVPKDRPGNCRGPNGLSNFDIGEQAHELIQRRFQSDLAAHSTEIEFEIPGSGANGGVGRADAVLFDEGQLRNLTPRSLAGIYEIKPSSYTSEPFLTSARTQLGRYVTNFGSAVPNGQAIQGRYWAPKNIEVANWTHDPTQVLVVSTYYNEIPQSDGLVLYWCRAKR